MFDPLQGAVSSPLEQPIDQFDGVISERTLPENSEVNANLTWLESVSIAPPEGITGKKWRCVIIEAGTSANRNHYVRDVLVEAAPKFENCPIVLLKFDGRKGRSEWADHPPDHINLDGTGREITGNTVGFLRDIRCESVWSVRQNREVDALTGDLIFIDPTAQTQIYNAYKEGALDPTRRALFELSIEVEGPHTVKFVEGVGRVRNVNLIRRVRNTAIVSEGSAGGRFLTILESLQPQKEIEHTFDNPNPMRQVFTEAVEQLRLIESEQHDDPLVKESKVRRVLVAALKQLGHKDSMDEATTGQLHKMLVERGSKVEEEEELASAVAEEEKVAPQDVDPMEGLGDLQKARQYLSGGDLNSGLNILDKLLATGQQMKQEEQKAQNQTQGQTQQQAQAKAAQAAPAAKSSVKESDETEAAGGEPVRVTESNTQAAATVTHPAPPGATPNHGMEPIMNKSTQPTEPGNGSSPGAVPEANPNTSATIKESEQSLTVSEAAEFINFLAQRDKDRETRFAEAMAEVEEIKQKDRLAESALITQNVLANSELPPSVQTLIAESFAGREVTEAEVTEACDRQRRILEKMAEAVAPGGLPTGGNGNSSGPYRVSVGRNQWDFVSADMDRCFGYKWQDDKSLTESQKDTYRQLDHEPSIKRLFMDIYDDRDGYMRKVGPNALIKEAASTDLSHLMDTSMYRALLQAYMSQAPLWKEVANVVSAPNFKEQDRILMGGLGILPRVVESDTAQTYFALGFPRTEQRTYNINTFGGLIIVTRQAIINDDLQGIQRYPKEAAEAAIMTLNKMVFQCLMGWTQAGGVNAALSYTGLPIYHAAHNNLIDTGGMSYENICDMLERLSDVRRFANVYTLAAGITAGNEDFDLSSAAVASTLKVGDDVLVYGGSGANTVEFKTVEDIDGVTVTVDSAFAGNHSSGARVEQLGAPVAFEDVKFFYSNQLKRQVYQLFASPLVPGSANNDASALYPDYQSGRVKPYAMHKMFLNNTLNNFFAAAGKPIEWAFLGGREDPEILLQDNPLVDNVFKGDQISWKLRHEHGGVLIDHRTVQAGIFA